MLGGIVLIVLSDATAKKLTEGYPVTEVVSLRGAIVLALIVVIAMVQGGRGGLRVLRINNRRGQALRASLACCSSFAFIFGLSYLPLADATAAAFTGPLFATALAAPMLGERVGRRRWLAVLGGFAGMVVMLRPGAGLLAWAMLLPAAAALFGALRDLVTRRISITETSWSILLSSNALLVVAGALAGVLMPAQWRVPGVADAVLLSVSGLLIGGAHFLHIEAYRFSEAATIGPFRYTSLLWAALLGYLVWGHVPDTWVLAGAALVVVSGLYVLRLEWRSRDPRGG